MAVTYPNSQFWCFKANSRYVNRRFKARTNILTSFYQMEPIQGQRTRSKVEKWTYNGYLKMTVKVSKINNNGDAIRNNGFDDEDDGEEWDDEGEGEEDVVDGNVAEEGVIYVDDYIDDYRESKNNSKPSNVSSSKERMNLRPKKVGR